MIVYSLLDSVRDLPVADNMVPKFFHDEDFIYFIYPNCELIYMRRICICWIPRGTSRQLIQDAVEEELTRPLQPRKSQKKTAIFTTIDCSGAVLCYYKIHNVL